MILTYVIYATDATNHHCMYRQIVSMQIHRMIMLTTTLLRANFYIIFSHHAALIGGKKKKQDAQKKKYSQEAAGAIRHQHRHHTLWACHPTFAKEQLQAQNKVGLVLVAPLWRIPKGMDGSAYACSSHHNPAGEYKISVIFFSWTLPRPRNGSVFTAASMILQSSA